MLVVTNGTNKMHKLKKVSCKETFNNTLVATYFFLVAFLPGNNTLPFIKIS